MAIVNPFRYTGPVSIDDLIDRDTETNDLLRIAAEGNNARLVAPRRFGKTSLLRRVAGEALADGTTSVYVDFFGVVSNAEIAARIETAYVGSLQGSLARWMDGVRRSLRPSVTLGGGPVPASAQVTANASKTTLEQWLALPERVHQRTKRRVLIIFDEFQDVLAADPNADAVIRSVIQHQGEFASYIFAGSHFGLMNELFANPQRAFYQQARAVALPPLPPEYTASFIAERFTDTNKDVGRALSVLLDIGAGHPQRTMLLAHDIWDLTGTQTAADEATAAAAIDTAVNSLAEEFRAVWSRMTAAERQIMAALAGGQGPYSQAAGQTSRSGSQTKNALNALTERADVTRYVAPAGDRYTIVDPLLAEWIRRGRSGT